MVFKSFQFLFFAFLIVTFCLFPCSCVSVPCNASSGVLWFMVIFLCWIPNWLYNQRNKTSHINSIHSVFHSPNSITHKCRSRQFMILHDTKQEWLAFSRERTVQIVLPYIVSISTPLHYSISPSVPATTSRFVCSSMKGKVLPWGGCVPAWMWSTGQMSRCWTWVAPMRECLPGWKPLLGSMRLLRKRRGSKWEARLSRNSTWQCEPSK